MRLNLRLLALSLLTWTLIQPLFVFTQSAVLVLDGVYQGRDLYIKNPFSADGVGFCVYEVEVNGRITSDEVNSSAFAIDMNNLGLSAGETILIKLKHRDACRPLVLNPEAIKPKSTYELIDFKVNNTGAISWTTKGESGQLPFVIEQYKWNKWVKVGEVMGAGTRDLHEYKYQLLPNSGVNKVRIKQVDYTNTPRYTPAREFVNPHISKVSFEPKKPTNNIRFSAETGFEIFDQYGNLVKRGTSREIDIQNLPPGEYYLNYDNAFGETFNKKAK